MELPNPGSDDLIKESNTAYHTFVHLTLTQWGVKDYTINTDMTVDINTDVSLLGIPNLEVPFQIGIVWGYFSCLICGFESFKGFPRKVYGTFRCISNEIIHSQENFDYLYTLEPSKIDIGDRGDPFHDAYQQYVKGRMRCDNINEILNP